VMYVRGRLRPSLPSIRMTRWSDGRRRIGDFVRVALWRCSDSGSDHGIAAAEISVRRLARTFVSTCIRFRSRSLIITSAIPLLSLLMGGTMTFLKSGYISTIHKPH
jgi:hypothetical protein